MDIRQIRDFVAVVRCASFAAASRELRVSQPGLGYQIKQLEQELQVQLLERHARGVSLTDAGDVFLKHAETILAAVVNAQQAMALLADSCREVRVGLSPSAAAVLGPLLLAAQGRHNLKLKLREAFSAELHDAVLRGALDFAVGLPPPAPLKAEFLYDEQLYLIGSLRETGDIALAEAVGYPLVMGPRNHTPRRALEDAAARCGTKIQVAQEVDIGSLRRALVLREGVYTVAAFGLFAEEIEKGLLGARRIADPEIVHSVNAIHAPDLPASLAEKLLALVREAVALAPLAQGRLEASHVAVDQRCLHA